MNGINKIRERHVYDSGIAFQVHPTMLRVLEEAHEDRGILLDALDDKDLEIERLRTALNTANGHEYEASCRAQALEDELWDERRARRESS